MSTGIAPHLTSFAADVLQGLSREGQKQLSPSFLYDDLGSALFEAITLLPEYGLTRADERLVNRLAPDLAARPHAISLVAELGSGSGKKTRRILEVLLDQRGPAVYYPIDVSQGALDVCERELNTVADVRPVRASWLHGLKQIVSARGDEPILLLFLGSSIGNLPRPELTAFLSSIRAQLRTGDLFLIGADLLKPVDKMVAAYDDPTGVTAAFNRNVLGRINRDLGGHFCLTAFRHEARWNVEERRIEMHLVSLLEQTIAVDALRLSIRFHKGESIWTEASHKFSEGELDSHARQTAFSVLRTWVDAEWPFAETLWAVE